MIVCAIMKNRLFMCLAQALIAQPTSARLGPLAVTRLTREWYLRLPKKPLGLVANMRPQ